MSISSAYLHADIAYCLYKKWRKKKDKKCAGRSRLQNVIIIVARGYYLSSRFGLKTNEFSMNACLCSPSFAMAILWFFILRHYLSKFKRVTRPAAQLACAYCCTKHARGAAGVAAAGEMACRGYILLFCRGKQFVIPGANYRAFVFVRLVGVIYNYYATVGIAR